MPSYGDWRSPIVSGRGAGCPAEVTMELFPCIVQDADTGEVLTLAYVNEESL